MKAFVAGAVVATAASLLGAVSYAAETSNQSPMLIGLIAGTTGAYGSSGIAVVNGAQLAVDKINAAGGVLGRQLKFDANNDDASATLSGQLFAKLVSAGAVAIAGSPDTGPVTAELAIRHKIPTIGVVDDGGLTVYPKGPTSDPNPGLRFWSEHVRVARRSANTRSSIVPTADWRCCIIRPRTAKAVTLGSSSPTTKPAKRLRWIRRLPRTGGLARRSV